LFVLDKTPEENRLITITKSNFGIAGPELAQAHISLGQILGEYMEFDPSDTTLVAILRGGIFFAEGLYFQMGCKFQLYNPKQEKFVRPETKYVILVDSVINTGKTIQDILVQEPDLYVACCVINEKAVPLFQDRLYTVRVSSNFFKGTNIRKQTGTVGPDTTMRLFNLL